MSEMKLTLYSYWRSSSSWRVRLALEAKGLDYEYVALHLVRDGGHQHGAEHVARNPMRQVPTLSVARGGEVTHVSQSLAIMELLEELVPAPSIFPEDVMARARARQLAEIINAGTQPLQNLAVIQHLRTLEGVDARAWCRRWVQQGLEGYQRTLGDEAGRFSVGDTPTVADFCLVPQLYNARRFELDLAPFDRLLAIEAACNELDVFTRAHPDAQPDFDPNASK